MKKYLIILSFPILFSSCNVVDTIGIPGIIALFVLILVAFGAMFYYIAKKKKQADLKLSDFSRDVQNMLDKFESPAEKLKALKYLIERIETDEAYKKTPDWKKSVVAKVYEHIAAICYGMGDEVGVIEACGNVIENDPSHGMSYYNRGSVYYAHKEFENALVDMNDAILLMPDYANAYNNRGLVYDNLNENEKALADYNRALDIEPSALTYLNRANLFYKQKMLPEAKADYVKFMELDADDQHALLTDVEKVIAKIDKQLG